MSTEKLSLLIAEDEPDLLDLYTQGFQMFGAEVHGAPDGLQAWEKFQEISSEIDLVISDIFMPGMNGAQLMDKIKDHSPNVPVFLITGYAHLRRLVEESEHEPDAFLEKPFDLAELFQRIRELIPGSLTPPSS
ncbi:MAG TPA: response regulator [Bacteroidetes bacterium]|nr:transcriptional regulatory protein CusR [bacterium BMS3Bbin04]HDO65760.1 response regulator [Bacteroidota bacterium]HEX04885.1 response regulator [Bacteroidota bacterium]